MINPVCRCYAGDTIAARTARNTYNIVRSSGYCRGDLNMPGAVAMAAEAALRAGAGIVTVVTQAPNAIVARIPEVMVVDAQSELAKGAIERADLLV